MTSWTLDDGTNTTTIEWVSGGYVTEAPLTEQNLNARTTVDADAVDLLDYVRYSDHVHYGTKNDGTVWYHENPPTAGKPSNFVLLTPPASVSTDEFYCVIVGGNDDTPEVGNPRRISLQIVWLAKSSEYVDRASAVADLEA